jgi:hypothetical protein
MALYGLGLWGQTLLAVAALGLVGGWALWPFRRADRPFLWLAAPLAGVATLSAALCLLYFVVGLTLPSSLAVSGLLALPTLALLARRARVAGWPWAAGAILAVSGAATLVSNATAVRLGEPTVLLRDGTDAVGYSLFADWFLGHPGQTPAYSPDRPHEAFVRAVYADPRRGAFLLAAAAARVRGTTALFSYDWANGVALACGALGLAGLFASGRRGLLLLLAAAAVSLWFSVSRCGYFGKTLAYPGCLLLCHVFWQAWQRFDGARLLGAAWLGAGVCLNLHPMVPQSVLGLVLCGLAAALVVHRLLRRPVLGVQPGRRLDVRLLGLAALTAAVVAVLLPPTVPHAVSRAIFLFRLSLPLIAYHHVMVLAQVLLFAALPLTCLWLRSRRGLTDDRRLSYTYLLRATTVYALMVGPLATWFLWTTPHAACPDPPLEWGRLAAIALDLDSAVLPLVRPAALPWLIGLALGLTGAAFLLAVRARDAEAQSYLLCVVLVPAAWLLGKTHLYEFQGLLFPLSAAGAVLVAQRLRQAPARWPGYAAAALAVVLVGLRAPQLAQTFPRYARHQASSPGCFTQSEVAALLDGIGGGTVDVSLPDVFATHVAMAELAARGMTAQYREPSWYHALAFTCWKAPDWPRKGDFTLGLAQGWAPPEAVRFRGRHYQLCAAEGVVTFLGYKAPHGVSADPLGRPCFWQGQAPCAVEIWNGTGRPQRVAFLADGYPGPSNPDLTRRTVRYAAGACQGVQAVGAANGWRLCAPLTLPPGRSRLALTVEEPATAPAGPNDPRDLLLQLYDLRLAPLPDGYPPGATAPAVPSPPTQE